MIDTEPNNRLSSFTKKLDELTALRQLKSPRSLSGRSIRLTLVTNWSWSWMTTPFVQYQSAFHSEIQLFQNFTVKINGQGHMCGQWWRSYFNIQIQRSRLWSRWNTLVTSQVCSSIDMLLVVSWQLDHFWLRYRKFHIWCWKFKVMANVKHDGYIWGLEFNRNVCFSFRGNQTISGWYIANSIFDLEKSRSRAQRKSTKF